MDQFFIITNTAKDPSFTHTGMIRDYLTAKGKTCILSSDTGRQKTRDGFRADIPERTDCVIVLGGDGTMLEAAHDVFRRDIPVLGVNLGTVGYLAEIGMQEIGSFLDRLIAGDYRVEQRMMLYGGLGDGFSHSALNDIVIARYGSVSMNLFHVYVNGLLLNSYHADGIILSTPTGSTGYNLSAGGPIIDPVAKMILMTPICPHTMTTRSIVLSEDAVVDVEIGSAHDGAVQEVEISFDNACKRRLHSGDRVTVRRSAHTTGVIRFNRISFLETLHRKLV